MINRKFSDIDLNFRSNTNTGDIYKVKDEQAIRQSLKTLIMTNHYERPFHPEIGSNVNNLLFEPISPITDIMLKEEITNIINNFEPRVKLLELVINSEIDSNEIEISINFIIINTLIPLTINFTLRRTR